MDNLQNYYGEQMAKSALVGSAKMMTLRDRLGLQKAQLEAQLSDVNEAIAALDSNPEITKALEAVQKVSRLM